MSDVVARLGSYEMDGWNGSGMREFQGLYVQLYLVDRSSSLAM